MRVEPTKSMPPVVSGTPNHDATTDVGHPSPTRVAIVSDVRLYRDGVATQLALQTDFIIVAAVESERDANDCISRLGADIVLVDTSVFGGLECARRLSEAHAGARVIVFAVQDTDADVTACAEAGVAGFVTREASVEDLVSVVRGVARGEIVCSPRAAAALYRRVAWLSANGLPASIEAIELTAREREVVRLIDRGMSNKDIARALGIGVATAKNHVHHILEKLHVGRRHEVARRARQSVLVESPVASPPSKR